MARPSLTAEQVRRLRMCAQRLEPPAGGADVAALVRDLAGVQAQDRPAAAMALRPRAPALTEADVARARDAERNVLVTWPMRGTYHMIASADAGWLMALLGPLFLRESRRRLTSFGVDEETTNRGVEAIVDLIRREGPRTRAEVAAHLSALGITDEPRAAYHLPWRTALLGHICLGPERAGEPTFVLMREWADVGEALPRPAALAELARRYLGAYAPAAPADMAAWSGLTVTDARAGFAALDLVEVDAAGRPAWMLASQMAWLDAPAPAQPTVRLLARFDIYMLGYATRDLTVLEGYGKQVNAGGGMISATLLVDGLAVGTWSVGRRKAGVTVAVEPWLPLDPALLPALEAEAADVGRFLGQPAELKLSHRRGAE